MNNIEDVNLISEIAVMSLSQDIWGRGRQSEKHALGYFCCHLVKGTDLWYAFEL